MTTTTVGVNPVASNPIRLLAGGIALIVVVDALSVQAPGLALVALPFVLTAGLYRRGGRAASSAVALASCLYVVVGVNYALANGSTRGGATCYLLTLVRRSPLRWSC